MKNTLLFFTFSSLFTAFSLGQCSNVSASVSSSTTTQINMYTAARYVVTPGTANLYRWELTNFAGTVLDSATTASDFQLLNFSAPLTDSIKVCLTVSNTSTGQVCSVCDTLTYGGTISNWGIITNNTGVSGLPGGGSGGSGGGGSTVSLSEENSFEANIYPNPTTDIISIKLSENMEFTAKFFNLSGQIVLSTTNQSIIEVSALPKGVYLLEIKGLNSNKKIVKKIVKL